MAVRISKGIDLHILGNAEREVMEWCDRVDAAASPVKMLTYNGERYITANELDQVNPWQ